MSTTVLITREEQTSKSGVVQSRRFHYGWLVVIAATLALFVSAGMRSVFGVLIPPLEQEFGWGRAALGGVAALSLFLFGAVGPLAGRFADLWGPRWVFVVSLIVVSVGTWGAANVSTLWGLAFTAGGVMALGAGGAAMSTASALAARWFEARRGLVLGILGAGMSLGQLVIIPLAMQLTTSYGWRVSLTALAAGILLIIVPVALVIRDEPARLGLRPFGADAISGVTSPAPVQALEERTSTGEAVRTLPFWLLGLSFFICGYTSAGLVLTHFIPHAVDHGFAGVDAAQALGLMGAMNVLGTIASGWVCDRFGRTKPLAFFYFFRGLTLLAMPWIHDRLSLHLFAALFGFNYLSTVPPTSGLTARIFGRRSTGELFGWIFVLHQAGAALGSWGGGFLYEVTGSYTSAFLSASILAFVAAPMVLAIGDTPLARRSSKTHVGAAT